MYWFPHSVIILWEYKISPNLYFLAAYMRELFTFLQQFKVQQFTLPLFIVGCEKSLRKCFPWQIVLTKNQCSFTGMMHKRHLWCKWGVVNVQEGESGEAKFDLYNKLKKRDYAQTPGVDTFKAKQDMWLRTVTTMSYFQCQCKISVCLEIATPVYPYCHLN